MCSMERMKQIDVKFRWSLNGAARGVRTLAKCNLILNDIHVDSHTALTSHNFLSTAIAVYCRFHKIANTVLCVYVHVTFDSTCIDICFLRLCDLFASTMVTTIFSVPTSGSQLHIIIIYIQIASVHTFFHRIDVLRLRVTSNIAEHAPNVLITTIKKGVNSNLSCHSIESIKIASIFHSWHIREYI